MSYDNMADLIEDLGDKDGADELRKHGELHADCIAEQAELCQQIAALTAERDALANALFDHGAGKLHEPRATAVKRFIKEAIAQAEPGGE